MITGTLGCPNCQSDGWLKCTVSRLHGADTATLSSFREGLQAKAGRGLGFQDPLCHSRTLGDLGESLSLSGPQCFSSVKGEFDDILVELFFDLSSVTSSMCSLRPFLAAPTRLICIFPIVIHRPKTGGQTATIVNCNKWIMSCL